MNDTYGHRVGDGVLEHFSGSLVRLSRNTDVVGRVGGEAFAIVLPETAGNEAIEFAEETRKEIDEHRYAAESGVSLHVTVSVGAATYQRDMLDQTELLRCADRAF